MGGVSSAASSSEASLYFLREPLFAFYQKHNPKKLNAVDNILRGFGDYGVEDGAQLLNVALIREYGVGLDTLSMKAKALYDYQSKVEGDLEFKTGQVIQVTSNKGDWWEGRIVNSKGKVYIGQFPSNRVKMIESNTISQHSAEDEKRGNKLFRAIFELVTSEFKYVQDLQTVQDVFVAPLQQGCGVEVTKQIFSSWTEVLLVHEQILSDMEKTLPKVKSVVEKFGNFDRPSQSRPGIFTQPTSRSQNGLVNMRNLATKLDTISNLHDDRIAMNVQLTDQQRKLRDRILVDSVTKLSTVMIKMSDFLKTAIPYIANYNNAIALVEKLHSTNPDAEKLIVQCEQNPLCNGLHLRDFLIKPVQRVCKYPLLIREIHSSTSDDAKRAAAKAQKTVMTVADQVNEMVKQSERANSKVLADFQSKFRPQDHVKRLGLDKPSTRLFRHGRIRVVLSPPQFKGLNLPNKDNLYAFLFTELILLTESHTAGSLLGKGKTTYKILQVVELANAIQATRAEEKYNNRTFSLEVAMGDDPHGATCDWVFALSGEGECDGWVADLAEALSITAADRARRSAVVEQRRERARIRFQQERQYQQQQMHYQQQMQMRQQQMQQMQQMQYARQQQQRQFASMYSNSSSSSKGSSNSRKAKPRVVNRPPQDIQTLNQLMWELNFSTGGGNVNRSV